MSQHIDMPDTRDARCPNCLLSPAYTYKDDIGRTIARCHFGHSWRVTDVVLAPTAGQVGRSAFPPPLDDARWIVSAQWASDADSPEAAAAEVRAMIGSTDVPLSVVNFDIGYRWTFE